MPKPKRLVTPQFQELHELFAKTITVRAIAEKLRACFADEEAALVRRRMEEARTIGSMATSSALGWSRAPASNSKNSFTLPSSSQNRPHYSK
jgi:alcohol dehydrogenase class IV